MAPGDITCAATSICVTPENLEGRVYAGGIMVGGTHEGPGYLITTVGATPEVRLRPDLGKDGEMTFNIRDATDLAGGYTCCEGSPYPTDDAAIVNRLGFTFDYLDATFTVPAEAGSNVAGNTYTLRFVYVTETTAPSGSQSLPLDTARAARAVGGGGEPELGGVRGPGGHAGDDHLHRDRGAGGRLALGPLARPGRAARR